MSTRTKHKTTRRKSEPATTPAATKQGRTTMPNLAVQLYTLRTLQTAPDAIMASLAEIGYQGVELAGNYGLPAHALRDILQRHNLRAVSAHVSLDSLEADLPDAIRYHKTLGNDVLVVPWVPETLRGATAASWQLLGERLAKLARRCAHANMQLMYHNHDFEMVVIDGRPAIDWLMEAAGPAVGFEIDLAWVQAGGQDPATMLRRYAGRVSRVHAKDWNAAQRDIADVGAGSVNWDDVLTAAAEAGVEWLIVEHDRPADPLASVGNSYAFLAGK
jgi:sugar phosphate isomerase/epimerase